MVSALRAAHQAGELHRLCGEEFEQRLSQLMQRDWVVFSKAYLKKAETIVRYLGRYTHKIALSDPRFKDIKGDQVRFHYKDYRDNKDKCMQLDGEEFIRRFLMHVLPEGFMRIRHYGFLSNRTRQKKLETFRICLQAPVQPTRDEEARMTGVLRLPSSPLCLCPRCRTGHLRVDVEIPAKPG